MTNLIIDIYSNLRFPMYSLLKKIYRWAVLYDAEAKKMREFFYRYSHQQKDKCKVLDVGCGYGRNLRFLQMAGYDAIGIDSNIDIIEKNKKDGMRCIGVHEFTKSRDLYDIVLMSHIIEHFHPNELKDFIDFYLDRLKTGGYLIIATPLMSDYFYDDFDHIKPYQPLGIQMVFGKNKEQVKYYSRNKLVLKDVWFRRNYYRFPFLRGRYVGTLSIRFYQLIHFFSAVLFIMSFRFFGKKDGWIGVFEKRDSGDIL